MLREMRLLQRLIGLNPLEGLESFAVRTFYLIAIISNEILLFIFFKSNIHGDTYRGLSSLPAFVACTAHMVAYFHLLVGRERLYSLLDELQSIVNESTI